MQIKYNLFKIAFYIFVTVTISYYVTLAYGLYLQDYFPTLGVIEVNQSDVKELAKFNESLDSVSLRIGFVLNFFLAVMGVCFRNSIDLLRNFTHAIFGFALIIGICSTFLTRPQIESYYAKREAVSKFEQLSRDVFWSRVDLSNPEALKALSVKAAAYSYKDHLAAKAELAKHEQGSIQDSAIIDGSNVGMKSKIMIIIIVMLLCGGMLRGRFEDHLTTIESDKHEEDKPA